MSTDVKSEFRLAVIQLAVGANKSDNLTRAAKSITEAAKQGAKIVSLPECCNSPYGTDYFPAYAEPIPGESTEVYAKAAKDNQVYLVAGSIPEKDNDKLYNTCTVFNPDGKLIAKHRKVHLFDIDIPGKIVFQESKVLSAGQGLTMFDTPFCKVGVGICYDIRFPELAWLYANRGCHLLLYPGAFNMTTGPQHWELLQRARALDNQLFVATAAPARDTSATYIAWGHSTVLNPWGDVIAKADEKEQIIYADIDLEYMNQVRQQIPLTKQKRRDMYEVKDLTK